MPPTAPSKLGRLSQPSISLACLLCSIFSLRGGFSYPPGTKRLRIPRDGWRWRPCSRSCPGFGRARALAAGAAYGIALYALSDYWLWTYHPAALAVACAYAGFGMALLFPLLSAVSRAFPRRGFWAYPFLWLSYEFLRSQGFMGYPTGFSDTRSGGTLVCWAWRPWGESGSRPSRRSSSTPCGGRPGESPFGSRRAGSPSIRGRFAVAALAAAAFASLAGAAVRTDYRPGGPFGWPLSSRIFGNASGPSGTIGGWSKSSSALPIRPGPKKPDLIVWHETAVVPPIGWHLRFRPVRETFDLVSDADAYIRSLDVPLLFGNGRAEPDGSDAGRRKNGTARSSLRTDGNWVITTRCVWFPIPKPFLSPGSSPA
jgi:apolipoprotein N-acyltransferase